MFTYDQIGLSVILTNTHSRKQLCVDLHEFFYRATRMHSADYAVARCLSSVCPSVRLSVRLSVCLSHAGIESKRLYISSKFFHHRVAPPF